jgi:predicted metal-dependent phosphoesterase TrpH
LAFDLHLHTSRYSKCSRIDAGKLIRRAAQVGLDGVVITEHHRIWEDEELEELKAQSDVPGFIVLAAFEYTSSQGDVLIYGLKASQEREFVPGRAPELAIERARELGAACIAAHPTRAGMGYDQRIFTMPLDAVEVRSVNLKEHEQRLAMDLAENAMLPPVTCSDAHRLEDVGRYATEFFDPIQSIDDLKAALKRGRFRPAQR